MDKKGHLLRMSSMLCALYDLSFFFFFFWTGIGTAQVYCASCDTKEARKMQGILVSLIDHS